LTLQIQTPLRNTIFSLEHSTSTNMSSPAEDLWPVLVGIIPSALGRPRCPDGQYVSAHIIDTNRQEGLNALLAPYSPVKIEQCLNPQTGKPFSDYYIATFPDFDAVREAKGAWNAVELDDNPWISMMVMEEVDEDVKMKKLLDEGYE
jgi:hypothetical protein